ncbi:zinc-ribbon domain-containing protein [Levilactobacillus brevis]|uniref:zinc-ribbon domain-containing protein n=1 Tax=Levilactobacillus brevis TaxID=1580 RepID=UPI000414FA4B|nr:zinc ribbon domain-containing protein [Levilactobacillus brevis]ARN93417.1 hypothetical protein AZI11_11205 [Levilactobacillus brevis]ARN96017.1 hypothetical protein AZI12_11240 [Levilactobacillus brevis]ATU70775.1 zinc-ribbon domain-containing protein [Levilactobacillus brevis]
MKYCSNCGHQLDDGAKFCPACGSSISGSKDEVVDSATEDHKKGAQIGSTKQTKSNQEADGLQTADIEQPQLGFIGSIQYIMQHVFEFNGDVAESRKSVFWWGYLGVFLLNFAFAFIPVIGPFMVEVTLILLVSACMRRLNYLGQAVGLGWLVMVPLVGLYPMFLMFLDKKG